MVSGGWTGYFTFYKGLGGGKFAVGTMLKDSVGQDLYAGAFDIVGKKDEKGNPVKSSSEGSAVQSWLIDYDGDSDLDLLSGNIRGHVIHFENIGDRARPVFRMGSLVKAGDSAIKVDNDAGPTTCDWDADGVWDLLVGGGMGDINFYKNVGTATSPKFAPAVELIPSWEGGNLKEGAAPTRSSYRIKINCLDWNRDGKLDILAGDMAQVDIPAKLSPAQRATRDSIEKALQENSKQVSEYYKVRKDRDWTAEEKAAVDKLSAESNKLHTAMRPLRDRLGFEGWVWVYLRKNVQAAR